MTEIFETPTRRQLLTAAAVAGVASALPSVRGAAAPRPIVRYWSTDYNWRKAEAKLNALPHNATPKRRAS